MMTTAFWDQRSLEYDLNIRKHDSIFKKTLAQTRFLVSATDRVLDFGCATGEMSLELAPNVERIRGIDTSGDMISLANDKALDRRLENVQFDQVGITDSSLDENSFSIVLAQNVLHLVDDPGLIMARIATIMAPGGLFISQTPCLGDWNWLLRSGIGLAGSFRLAPSITAFRAGNLEKLVSGAGLSIQESVVWDDKHKIQWITARKAKEINS